MLFQVESVISYNVYFLCTKLLALLDYGIRFFSQPRVDFCVQGQVGN
jgi:hypothetical protein